ncbi:hypothetical protein PGTUg99_024577 [Puccinia graminis f. sp. tritici]|uniref:Uncharacterized protein n=1 Tax=Puccinia graminis f. sp. tritici TaxID=56615 RepID=A0A5B0NUF4_PUCGR|nr:hypothetical protein PGTUg99_024577 [Puccinia graminis f. sp. tritici]
MDTTAFLIAGGKALPLSFDGPEKSSKTRRMSFSREERASGDGGFINKESTRALGSGIAGSDIQTRDAAKMDHQQSRQPVHQQQHNL